MMICPLKFNSNTLDAEGKIRPRHGCECEGPGCSLWVKMEAMEDEDDKNKGWCSIKFLALASEMIVNTGLGPHQVWEPETQRESI